MSSVKSVAARRALSIILSIMLVLSVFGFQKVDSHAAHVESYNGIYCTQKGSGYCTLASAVMMIRAKASATNPYWNCITQSSIESTAWVGGLRGTFTYAGITVTCYEMSALKGSTKKEKILNLLNAHPEGIEIYDKYTVKHAVYLREYKNGIFYCGDPAISASKIPLANSWNAKKIYGAYGKGQDKVIEAIDKVWIVTGYSKSGEDSFIASMQKAGKTPAGILQNNSDGIDVDPVIDPKNPPVDNPDSPVDNPDPPVEEDPPIDGLVADDGNMNVLMTSSAPTAVRVQFAHVNQYNDSMFYDVNAADWFTPYVKNTYEVGLMCGVGDNKFEPSGNVTLAQAVTMAARISDRYNTFIGKAAYNFTANARESWYMPYLHYAYANGIISTYIYNAVLQNPNAPAVRQDFAVIVSGAMPEEALDQINLVWPGDILDVDYNTYEGKIIYTLYEAGIFNGKPGGGFDKFGNLSRAEAATVISRMGDYTMRVEL